MHTENSFDQLPDKIMKAFPSPYSFSHEDCTGVRKQLFSSEHQDVLNFLGPVLVDLVLHHSRSSCDPATADSVVRFLASASPPPLETLPGKPFDTAQLEDFIIAEQTDSKLFFDAFSREQASAITEWLEAALSWAEPHLPEREIKAALEYWGKTR
jgi:hypothetical protein